MKYRYFAYNLITGECFACTRRRSLKGLRGAGWVFSPKHWQVRALRGIYKGEETTFIY